MELRIVRPLVSFWGQRDRQLPCLAASGSYLDTFMEDLDTSPTGFDRELPETSSAGANKLVLIALLVGVVGILFGVTGIYLATQASNALGAYKTEQAAATNPVVEGLAAHQKVIDAKIDEMDGRLGNVGGSIVRLQRQGSSAEVTRQLEELHTQTQTALKSISGEVQANRTQLNETISRLEQLAGGGTVARTTARPSTSSSSDAAAAPIVPAGGTLHTVKTGENLSLIARDYGITLAKLMQANPTVEPKRMMPGDQIVIPAP